MTASPIRRWAVALRVLVVIAMVVIALAVVFGAAFAEVPTELAAAAGLSEPPARITIVAAALIGAIPTLAILYVLGQMFGLFGLYAAGETLTPLCARHISRIGSGLLVSALLEIVTRPAQIVLLSLANPPGERVLAVSLQGADLGLVLAGGLLVTIGWAMGDAVRAAEENRSFV